MPVKHKRSDDLNQDTFPINPVILWPYQDIY